jgi:hypothetical protein
MRQGFRHMRPNRCPHNAAKGSGTGANVGS